VTISSGMLKRGLVFFWAAWLTIVLATNCLDALQVSGLLPASWKLVSGNFKLIADTTAVLGVPAWGNVLLFAGVILWEGLGAALLWRAWARFHASDGPARLNAAFAVTLALCAAFLLTDELFVAYSMEAVHIRLLIAQLATLLAAQLLPDKVPA